MSNITKQIFSTLLLFFVFTNYCFADAPPCWCNFEVTSANGQYIAKVYRDSTKVNKSTPIFEGWVLSVSDSKLNKQLWKTKYDYSGYPDGYLTDNGQSFVYVEFWYYEQLPLVKIYTNGNKINTDKLVGNVFKVDKRKIVETISHKLWLKEDGGFAATGFKKYDYLELITIDKRKHKINLVTGKKIE